MRNFFGVLNVVETDDGRFRVLWHGTTAQGAQRMRDDDGNLLKGRPEMIVRILTTAAASRRSSTRSRARRRPDQLWRVIGLGTGALACQRAAPATR